jgi:hypothetical protein
MIDISPGLFLLLEPHIRRSFHGESFEDVEVTYSQPGREEAELFLLLSYEPARDEADEIIGVSIAIADYTERKRANEVLRSPGKHDVADQHHRRVRRDTAVLAREHEAEDRQNLLNRINELEQEVRKLRQSAADID